MRKDPFEFLNQYVKVSRETFERLNTYHDLLLKWQPKINLVGPDTIQDFWNRHFLDSLQLLHHIPDQNNRIVDLGSGAGFPGMALAIAGCSDVHLIESDTRKATFLREVSRVTHTTISIHASRIESAKIDNISIITSRACSNLDTLLRFSSRLVSHETFCLFHKGKNYSMELDDANKHWHFNCTIIPSIVSSITDSQGVILKIEHLRERGSWPQQSKEIQGS